MKEQSQCDDLSSKKRVPTTVLYPSVRDHVDMQAPGFQNKSSTKNYQHVGDNPKGIERSSFLFQTKTYNKSIDFRR